MESKYIRQQLILLCKKASPQTQPDDLLVALLLDFVKGVDDIANDEGYAAGHNNGHVEGHAEGYDKGLDKDYKDHAEGHAEDYDEGYREGYDEGYSVGYNAGFANAAHPLGDL